MRVDSTTCNRSAGGSFRLPFRLPLPPSQPTLESIDALEAELRTGASDRGAGARLCSDHGQPQIGTCVAIVARKTSCSKSYKTRGSRKSLAYFKKKVDIV